MALIRDDLRKQILRWREAIFGGALSFVGMYWAVTSSGVAAAAGTSFAVVGSLLVFAGIQRTRFRRGGGGPGVVQVDERQVTYFGPHDGGVVSIDALERVELEPAARPAGAWVLTEAGNRTQPLQIPTNAENAEALFDVFAALDGLRTEHMLAQLSQKPAERVTIWDSGPRRLH